MRSFAILVLALLVRAASAQGLPVIGYLGAESPGRFASRLEAFKRGLAELSFAEGRNVAIEYRWANGDNSRLPELAAEKATSSIPLVFGVGVDPIAAGLVRTMNRPGGNATGIATGSTELAPQRLHLLRELVPQATKFALLVNPTNEKNAEGTIDNLQVASHAQRLQL